MKNLNEYLNETMNSNLSTCKGLYDELRSFPAHKSIMARGESGMLEITEMSNYNNPDIYILRGDHTGRNHILTVGEVLKILKNADPDNEVLVEYDGDPCEILDVEQKNRDVILYLY